VTTPPQPSLAVEAAQSAPAPASPPGGPFGHEQVVYCSDPATGLRAIIALYSTALGPALGGTRFYPYASEEAALADVLRLSRGMAYKNALAGLEHGGGKAVIIGDPGTDKTPELLRAYGRFVESLGGRYVTACDVGTYVADMDVVSETTRWATGRSEAKGGAGNSSVLTAYGVFQGMRACAQHLWRAPTLHGRTVGIAGVGKVGRLLTAHLLEDGARVVVTDVDPGAVEAVRALHPEVRVVEDTTELVRSDIDVYAPCALGGALDDATVDQLRASVVCGGANNQLATEGRGGATSSAASTSSGPRRRRRPSSSTRSTCWRPPPPPASHRPPPPTGWPSSAWRPRGGQESGCPAARERAAARAVEHRLAPLL
jgi:valine dehydrogenase (NAD+)